MKRKLNHKLLVTTGALAGVVIGASLALAAYQHAPIQLFTFEEIGMQMADGAAVPVQVDQNGKGMPYSPKMTCGTAACHNEDYNKISDHAFHSAQGRNEFVDTEAGTYVPLKGMFPNNTNKPWTVQSTAMVGKW